MGETIDLRVRIRALIDSWHKQAGLHKTHGDCYRVGQGWGLEQCANELAEALSVLQGEAAPPLKQLVRNLQAHAKEHGWQDVDEPIAALLAWADAAEVIRTPQERILERALSDREKRPWRYYRLEYDDLKRMADHLRDKLDAIEAGSPQTPAPAQGWQPIDTAPKDGRRVLVAFDWTGHVSWAHYDSRGDDEWKVCGVVGGQPTHWMPLPAPPLVSESPPEP